VRPLTGRKIAPGVVLGQRDEDYAAGVNECHSLGLSPADKRSATANHVAADRPVLCLMLTRETCV